MTPCTASRREGENPTDSGIVGRDQLLQLANKQGGGSGYFQSWDPTISSGEAGLPSNIVLHPSQLPGNEWPQQNALAPKTWAQNDASTQVMVVPVCASRFDSLFC
jgi:hypothetical protein